MALHDGRGLHAQVIENYRNHGLKEERIDLRKRFKSDKESYQWFKRAQRRLWLMTHVFKKRPIWVYECSEFPASWLDVSITLPTWRGFQERWIFTVSSKHHLLQDDGMEDAQITISIHMEANEQDIPKHLGIWKPLDFWTWLEDNVDEALKYPLIEYDDILVNQDNFSQEDVIKFTKLWIKKWYPKLADRAVIWKEWTSKDRDV